MEPKAGQIWRCNYDDEKDFFIFITKITSNGHKVDYYILKTGQTSWDYKQQFEFKKCYELVSG